MLYGINFLFTFPLHKFSEDLTISMESTTHRIRMASSPNGSLLLFFSASLAFFFFRRLILSFSLLDRTRFSWWGVCCIQALEMLPSSSLATVGRCLTLTLRLFSDRSDLILLITKTTIRGSKIRRPTEMAATTQIQAGVFSLKEIMKTVVGR